MAERFDSVYFASNFVAENERFYLRIDRGNDSLVRLIGNGKIFKREIKVPFISLFR